MWLALTIASQLVLAAADSGSGGCTAESVWTSCETSNNGSSVSIGATRESSSTPATPPRGSNDGGSGGGGYVTPVHPPPRDPNAFYPGSRTRDEWLAECAFGGACAGVIVAPGDEPVPGTEQAVLQPADPAEPPMPDPTTATIDDVAEFAPTTPPLLGEPDGIGVVGMPTNFVVDATEHTVDGEIFDIPVTVRFTPVSYLFDFGDGATRETTSPGTTWEDLDAPQFTATETSHSYSETGEYEAQVTIRYAAEADAGAGWFPIAGLLELDTPTTVIRVVDVDTALVQRTCDEDPRGPGC